MQRYYEWRPASGYRSQSGKSLWRVVREHAENRARFEQLKTSTGRLALFRTYEAAKRRADKLNQSIESAFRRPPYGGGNPSDAEKLVRAYRYWRKRPKMDWRDTETAYGIKPVWRGAIGEHATEALERARADVANGNTRYPSDKIYPAVSWQPGKPGLAFIENPKRAGLRFVGRVMPECDGRNGIWDSRGDCGWHTDPGGDVFKDGTGIAWGVVYQLPGKAGCARFVAGYVMGGCSEDWPTLDLSTIYVGERDDYAFNRDVLGDAAAADAARVADSMAERAAEEEREHNAAWQAGNAYADAIADIETERAHVKGLLSERKQALMEGEESLLSGREYKTICETIRREVARSLANIQGLRERRDKLASGDYVAEWLPGFYPSDTLRAAFNEGAGKAVL